MRKLKGNVIKEKDFKPRTMEVLEYVAETVATTLGPFGHNVLIQNTDRIKSTKDGWTVLKNIQFDNPVDNSIKSLIEAVAHSVVLRVGDGSTSSTYLAYSLMKQLDPFIQNNPNIPIRTIEDTLVEVVDAIEMEIRKESIAIDEDNMADMIKKVALVSSNWNESLAQMIADIYTTTNNPIIKVQNSGTDKTVVEYIDGYDLSGRLMINQYINNPSESKCEVKDPYILVFGFKIHTKYFIPLSILGNAIQESTGRQVIIMAPGFEAQFINNLIMTNSNNVKNKKPMVNLIPVEFDYKFRIDKECTEDFTVLTESTIIGDDNEDIMEMLDDITTAYTKPVDGSDVTAKATLLSMSVDFLSQYAGKCGKAVIGSGGILVQDFECNDYEHITKVISERKEAVSAEILAKTKEFDALTMITDDIRMKRIRLGKLQCKMGVIKVGGFGDSDLANKKDAVDDTIRACEAAYRDGVCVGSNITLAKAAVAVRGEGEVQTSIREVVAQCILNAVIDLYGRLVMNKYSNITEEEVQQILTNCVAVNGAYDLLNDDYDVEMNIINPTNVDVEVIRGCLKLVLNTITSSIMLYKWYPGQPDIMEDSSEEITTLDDFVDNISLTSSK